MGTTVTTIQKGIEPFSPRRTQGSPGGSEILDRNLDLIKKHLDQLTPAVSQIIRTLNLNVSDPGSGGGTGGGMTFDFSDATYNANSPSGAETWCAERMCPFGNVSGANCSLQLVALAMSSAGPGVFHVRVGGTTGQIDGTLVAAILVFGATFHLITYGPTSIPNPGVTELVKVTGFPSAAGQRASIRSISLSVR